MLGEKSLVVLHMPCFVEILSSQDILCHYKSFLIVSVEAISGILLQYVPSVIFMKKVVSELFWSCVLDCSMIIQLVL